MKKNKLKKSIITLSLAGIMIGSTGCSNNVDEYGIPIRREISSSYSKFDRFTKYVINNGVAERVYKSGTIYLFFDKNTYNVTECIYIGMASNFGDKIYETSIHTPYGSELYDLETGEMLVYHTGHLLDSCINRDYFNYLLENSYQVYIGNISDYVENFVWQEYYSLKEIRELEQQITEALKKIENAKVRTR